MTRRTLLAGSVVALGAAACSSSKSSKTASPPPSSGAPAPAASGNPEQAAATTDVRLIASRATVPVLCWHQLRDWRAGDTSYNRTNLICPPANFRAQLDALRGAGYTTIDPDQYLAHMTTGAPLPPRPILLSFDDAQGSQITNGLPELEKRSMRGTFFIMTVVLGKTNWMSKADLKNLDRAGMTIASHTYDHHEVDKYKGMDYQTQLDAPRRELEAIIGKPVRHFAYPYGAWNTAGFPHIREAGYETAFQLSDRPMDPQQPLYTLRRILMNSTWTGPELLSKLPKT